MSLMPYIHLRLARQQLKWEEYLDNATNCSSGQRPDLVLHFSIQNKIMYFRPSVVTCAGSLRLIDGHQLEAQRSARVRYAHAS